MNKLCHIKIEFDVDLGIDAPAGLQDALQSFFHQWSDGRHNFSTEMVQHGLVKAVEAAVERAIETEKYAQHGSRMVSAATGKIVKNVRATRSATSLAHLKTQKAMKAVRAHIRGNIDCTEVTNKED